MRIALKLITTFALMVTALSAQTLPESDLFVADRGNAQNGSDGGVRRYTYAGEFIETLPANGMGQVRGITVDLDGTIYVARGNDVVRYDSPALTPAANPVHSANKAQDIAIHPVTGNLWCSFGSNLSEAEIREIAPDGTLLQTLTTPLLDQPRSLVFDEAGTHLFIANVQGMNVIALDTTATPPSFSIHTDTSTFDMGFTPIHITRDRSSAFTDLYVTGDFVNSSSVLRVMGDPGQAATITAFSYATVTDFQAPGGLVADSWGNLHIACRDRGMSTPGTYVLNRSTGSRVTAPSIGTDHINPVDLDFLRRPLSLEIQTGANFDPVFTGTEAQITVGENIQQTVELYLQAPDYPASTYFILFSLITTDLCADPLAMRPSGTGLPLGMGEPRLVPLEFDNTLLSASGFLNATVMGINPVPVVFNPVDCPTSIPGSIARMVGGTDNNGFGSVTLTFPTFPNACFGNAPFSFRIGFTVTIFDNVTGTTGVGVTSPNPTCLRVTYDPNS